MNYSFSTALSGLRASSESLAVTGNNIANANTTAYKSSSVSFADVYATSQGVRLNGAGTSMQIGNGVRTASIVSDFSQGALTDSSNPASAAVQGNGFFVVRDTAGVSNFTRAGDFTIDREGFLVAPNGANVQGYGATDGIVQRSGELTSLRIPVGEMMPPKMTTEAALRLNLDSSAPTSTTFHAPVTVYDSRGDAHTLDLTFERAADGSYSLSATLDGNAAEVSADTVTFDADGKLTAPETLTITPDQAELNGASLPTIDITMFESNPDGTPGAALLTNYAAPSGVASTMQDGFSAGTLDGLSFGTDTTGTIFAVFSNGQSRAVGQFALATFNSETSLRHLGNNMFGETLDSGQPSIGTPDSGGRGRVVGGVIEQSNVDIATEFTNLIVAQRGYQANSRVITTINQTLQDLMQSI